MDERVVGAEEDLKDPDDRYRSCVTYLKQKKQRKPRGQPTDKGNFPLEDGGGMIIFLGHLVLWISVWYPGDLAHQACLNPDGCSHTVYLHAATKGKGDFYRCTATQLEGVRSLARTYSLSWGNFSAIPSLLHYDRIRQGYPEIFPPWFWYGVDFVPNYTLTSVAGIVLTR